MDGRRVASLMCMCFAIAADPAMWIIWPVLVAILLALAVMWVVSHIVVILIAMSAVVVLGISATWALWKSNSRVYSPSLQVQAARMRTRQEEVSAGQGADCVTQVRNPETSNHYHLHLHGVDVQTAKVLVNGTASLRRGEGGDAMIR